MKNIIRALELLVILTALVVGIAWLRGCLWGCSPHEDEAPPSAPATPITEMTPSAPPSEARASKPTPPPPIAEIREEPTKPPRFEDLPPEKQQQFLAGRAKIYGEAYARRFKMSLEEWNALSPKEQRILIRKGKRE